VKSWTRAALGEFRVRHLLGKHHTQTFVFALGELPTPSNEALILPVPIRNLVAVPTSRRRAARCSAGDRTNSCRALIIRSRRPRSRESRLALAARGDGCSVRVAIRTEVEQRRRLERSLRVARHPLGTCLPIVTHFEPPVQQNDAEANPSTRACYVKKSVDHPEWAPDEGDARNIGSGRGVQSVREG
jgi:hypothetical protein